VFELLGAAGQLWRPTRRVSGCSLFALTLAVTPAPAYMLQRSDLFASVPNWALVLRLPLQMALLVLIFWSRYSHHEALDRPASGGTGSTG